MWSRLSLPSSSLSQLAVDERRAVVANETSSCTGEPDWEEELVTVVTDVPAVSGPLLHGFVLCNEDVIVAVVTVWVVVVTLVKQVSRVVMPLPPEYAKPDLESGLTRL